MIKGKYFIILFLIAVAGVAGFWWTKNSSSERSVDNSETAGGTPTSAGVAKPATNYPQIIGNFLVKIKEI